MCIICRGEDLTGLEELDIYNCQNITEIPNIEGLKKIILFLYKYNRNSKYRRITSITLLYNRNSTYKRITTIKYIRM